jgi:hypothetical protein
MIKAPIDLQDLRRRLYIKAKAEPFWRLRRSKRQGFGWKRWSRRWLYDTLGLFDAYRVSYRPASPKARPAHEVP